MVCTIYSFGYGMELLSTTLAEVNFWGMVQYFGIPYIPMFWILYSMAFGRISYSRSFQILLGVIPVITTIMRITNGHFHLFYKEMKLVSNGYFMVLQTGKNVWFYVQFFYFILCALVSVYIYADRIRRTNGTMKKQAFIMFMASLLSLIPVLLNFFSITPIKLELGPFFILIIYGIILIAVYRYHMLNLLPIIKDKIFNFIQDGVIVLDMENNIIEYNPAARKLFGIIKRGEKIIHISQIFKNQDELLEKLSNIDEEDFEIQLNYNEAESIYFHVRISRVYDGDYQIGRTALFNDITRKVELMKQLEYFADTDELTGIHNRRAFVRKMEEEFENSKKNGDSFAFVLMDIDLFKKINDTYGHLAGDAVLVEIAKRSRNILKDKGILGRFGGEEFCMIFSGINKKEVLKQCELLRQAYSSSPVYYEEQEITFTASFGIAFYDFKTITAEEVMKIIKHADAALYKAKTKGRNMVEIYEKAFE
jgi:diguanylate cyclase (GGDEF)-like protein